MPESSAWPLEMRVSADRSQLAIRYDTEEEFVLPAEMLRVLSPSAEVQGHSPEQRVTVAGKKDVRIEKMLATGNYAVRIVFSDGHDTGIFTWAYLLDLGRNRQARWEDYLEELADKNLSRE